MKTKLLRVHKKSFYSVILTKQINAHWRYSILCRFWLQNEAYATEYIMSSYILGIRESICIFAPQGRIVCQECWCGNRPALNIRIMVVPHLAHIYYFNVNIYLDLIQKVRCCVTFFCDCGKFVYYMCTFCICSVLKWQSCIKWYEPNCFNCQLYAKNL